MRAILFDLDDTLVDQAGAASAAVTVWAAESGVPGTPEQHRSRWAEVSDRHYDRYQARELTFTEQRRERAREFLDADLSDSEADTAFAGYLARYEANWRVFPDARPAIRRAVAAGLVVGVLTNGDRAHQAHKLALVGLDDLGLHLFASSEFPRGKPDPAPFVGSCTALGVAPAEAVMVGNSLEKDVHGAVDAGLGAVLLDRHDEHPNHEGRRIRTLDELAF